MLPRVVARRLPGIVDVELGSSLIVASIGHLAGCDKAVWLVQIADGRSFGSSLSACPKLKQMSSYKVLEAFCIVHGNCT